MPKTDYTAITEEPEAESRTHLRLDLNRIFNVLFHNAIHLGGIGGLGVPLAHGLQAADIISVESMEAAQSVSLQCSLVCIAWVKLNQLAQGNLKPGIPALLANAAIITGASLNIVAIRDSSIPATAPFAAIGSGVACFPVALGFIMQQHKILNPVTASFLALGSGLGAATAIAGGMEIYSEHHASPGAARFGEFTGIFLFSAFSAILAGFFAASVLRMDSKLVRLFAGLADAVVIAATVLMGLGYGTLAADLGGVANALVGLMDYTIGRLSAPATDTLPSLSLNEGAAAPTDRTSLLADSGLSSSPMAASARKHSRTASVGFRTPERTTAMHATAARGSTPVSEIGLSPLRSKGKVTREESVLGV